MSREVLTGGVRLNRWDTEMPSENRIVRFGTRQHAKLLDKLIRRKEYAQRKLSGFYNRVADMEDQFSAYIKTSDVDAERKSRKKTSGIQDFVTVEIPYTYAMTLTAHTYLSAVYLSRYPIFQFTGRHGESAENVQAIEALIDYQVRQSNMMRPLFNWLLDGGRRIMGIGAANWQEQFATVGTIMEAQDYLGPSPISGAKRRIRKVERVLQYQGNVFENCHVKDFFWDPRVSVENLEQGEFAGRVLTMGWNKLQEGKATGKYFNIEALKMARSQPDWTRRFGAGTSTELPDYSNVSLPIDEEMQGADVTEMVVELIPKEWKLGSTEWPEKWIFLIGNDEIIILAQPLSNLHARYPYLEIDWEIDAYEVGKRSPLEMAKPLNDVLSWLFNTHMYNVRRVLNDQLIYDPMRISEVDLEEGGAGRLVRVKPAGMGQDIRTMLMQLPVVDVTANHLRDSRGVIDLIQAVLGINDNMMAMPAPGGRKTATEVRSANSFGLNRQRTIAEYGSDRLSTLAQIMVQNSQQYYDDDILMKVVGDLPGAGDVRVTPDRIAGSYDYVPVDGSVPVDKFAQANLGMQVWERIAKTPLAQNYNMDDFLAWVVQLSGFKNIKRFRTDVVPDEELSRNQEAGNVVPLQEAPSVLQSTAGGPII